MTDSPVIQAEQAAERGWDVIIVGAGMGGCAAAYALSRQALDVLIIEKGREALTVSKEVAHDIHDPEKRLSIGRWPTQLTGVVDKRRRQFWPPLGCGVGGSTQLYAAALDRFRPSDFDRRSLPDGRDIGWPIGYDKLDPYYDMAEKMLHVRGTPDQLQPDTGPDLPLPPEMSERDKWFFNRFKAAKLHPYRLHCGVEFKEGCNNCLGRVCLRDCKRHAANSFLAPAVASGRVSICAQTAVTRLNAGPKRVETVTVEGDGQVFEIAASTVVVASGAFFSPVLLLNSANKDWPAGLANHNDQVGRNLMFHSERRLALWPRRGLDNVGVGKSITLRDFYEDANGDKFGEFQATGAEARYGNIIYAMRQRYDLSIFSRVPILRHFLRIPAFLADRFLGGAAIFALIIEDYPYPDNRVVADPEMPSGMRFDYTIPEELRSRTYTIVTRLNAALRGIPKLWLSPAIELNYGHPCGTCRSGAKPDDSVVDADGKAHGLENLYLTCASVFSTSGGTNPSLTIAALGLRTGMRLAGRLGTDMDNQESRYDDK